jgi:importin subunit beta-1
MEQIQVQESEYDLIVKVLEKTISPDTHELESAQQILEAAAATNLCVLLQTLSKILKDASKGEVARMQAGLQLKNAIYSKDPAIKAQHQHRWLSFDEISRNGIKENVLNTIGTENIRPSSAAQCVAYIACAELPHNLWPDLIDRLTTIMIKGPSTEMMREATLEAIGYICQDIDPEILQPQSDIILTAIVQGMRKDEPCNNVRLAATTALLNSLEFTRANFEKEVYPLLKRYLCVAMGK